MKIWATLLKLANHAIAFGLNTIGVPVSASMLSGLEDNIYHGKFGDIPKTILKGISPSGDIGGAVKELGSIICSGLDIPLPDSVLGKIVDKVLPTKKKKKRSNDNTRDTVGPRVLDRRVRRDSLRMEAAIARLSKGCANNFILD